MKIVLTGITQSGVLRCSKELIGKLSNAGHHVTVIAPSDVQESPQKETYDFLNIGIQAHGMNPLKDLRVMTSYVRFYRSIRPDVVVNYTIKPNIYSGIACRMCGLPYISSINGIGDALYNPGILRRIVECLLRIGIKKASAVIFQNESNREMFIRDRIVPAAITSVVPGSGINLAEHPYEPYPSSPHMKLLYIGRVTRDKGCRELLEAAGILKAKYGEELTIRIVGSVSDSFRETVSDYDSRGIIEYVGKVPAAEIHLMIKEADAAILPSYHEGMANVMLEAAAAGRPVLTTFVEGCKETFDDGITGIGFREKSTNAIVDAVERFMQLDKAQREQMGRLGREKMERVFDRTFVDDAYLKAIDSAGDHHE